MKQQPLSIHSCVPASAMEDSGTSPKWGYWCLYWDLCYSTSAVIVEREAAIRPVTEIKTEQQFVFFFPNNQLRFKLGMWSYEHMYISK